MALGANSIGDFLRMSDGTAIDLNTAENKQTTDEPKKEKTENGQNSADVINLDTAKIAKYRKNIKELRESILPKLSSELKEVKRACNSAKKAIGELNDNNKRRRRKSKNNSK